ncbi:MAG: hypothetical protein ACM359_21430, partial [Bacillota bacterium]
GKNRQVIRWPEYLAVAAILLLALGLGVIVYLVLPPKHPMVTIVPPPELLRERIEAADQPSESVVVERDLAEAGQPKAAIQGDMPAVIQRGEAVAKSAGNPTDPVMGTLMVMGDGTGANGAITVHTAAFFRESPSNETLVITVKAADVQLVNAELVKYLSENKIAWAAAESQLVSLTEGPVPAVPAKGSANTDQPVLGAGISGRQQPAGLTADVLAMAGVGGRQNSDEKRDESGELRGVTQNALAEQLAQVVRRSRMLAGDASVQSIMLAKDNLRLNRGERVILAKDVSSHQLTELRTTLAQSPRGNQDEPTPAVAFYYAKPEPPQFRGTLLLTEGANAVPATLPSTNPAVALGDDVSRSMMAGRRLGAARSTLSPTTLPATQPAVAAMPTPVPVTFELAATQPTAVAGSFNCVIVLEDTDHPAATTQPAARESDLPPATMPSVPATYPVSAEEVR